MKDRNVGKLRTTDSSNIICRTAKTQNCKDKNSTELHNSFSALSNSDDVGSCLNFRTNSCDSSLPAPPTMFAVIGKIKETGGFKNKSNLRVRTTAHRVTFCNSPIVTNIPLEWFEWRDEHNKLLPYPNPPRIHVNSYTSSQLKYCPELYARGVAAAEQANYSAHFLAQEISGFAVLSRIVDTGAGGHLIGAGDACSLPQQSIAPQRFSTASGITTSNAVTKENLSDLGKLTSHILKDSPNALSVGCLVNENQIGFTWLPQCLTAEQSLAVVKVKRGIPTFILPNGKLQELRVEGNVPIHDEQTTSVPATPAPAIEQEVVEEAASVDAEAVAPPLAPPPDAIAPRIRRPKQPHNLVTHLPADADCDICRIAKQKREASRIQVLDETDYATEWGEKIMFDHFIGTEPCLTLYDEGTNTIAFYPGKSRKTAEVELAFRKFCGSDLDKVKLLYSDNAPEFKKLARKLKLPK